MTKGVQTMLTGFLRAVRQRLRLLAVDERGDVVNWLIVTLGIAIAAAAVIAVLRPAIESAGRQIASLLGG